jgi:hypothetical protein
MARTKKGGIEYGRPRLPEQKPAGEIAEESEEEQQKRRKVLKINHVYHVREWIPETEAVSGEPVAGNTNIPVKLKEITRLERPEERDERKAAYAEAKRIALEAKLKFWLQTEHPWVVIRPHHGSLGQVIKYAASRNCLLGIVPYERLIKSPQVFVSCIEATQKSVPSNKKNYLVVGMLVELFSYSVIPVLLHSIIMHQESPHR